jgi:hypothetical protein
VSRYEEKMIIPLFLLLLVELGAEYKPFRMVEADDALYSVFVGPTNREDLEKKVLGMLGSHLRVVRITVFETEDAARLGIGLGQSEWTYMRWFRQRKEVTLECLPAFDLVGINGNLGSRRVAFNCQISKKVIIGANPLIFETPCQRYVIQDFEFLRGKDFAAKWFVRTSGKVDAESARSALEEVKKWADPRNITLVLRNDPWFLLPIFNPLVLEPVPTRSEYIASPQATCVLISGYPIHCWMDKNQ